MYCFIHYYWAADARAQPPWSAIENSLISNMSLPSILFTALDNLGCTRKIYFFYYLKPRRYGTKLELHANFHISPYTCQSGLITRCPLLWCLCLCLLNGVWRVVSPWRIFMEIRCTQPFRNSIWNMSPNTFSQIFTRNYAEQHLSSFESLPSENTTKHQNIRFLTLRVCLMGSWTQWWRI